MNQKQIRNFCIIAHIDHGKSTLADRLLELTHTIDKRTLKQQTLDSMELEREKGITIKLKAVRMKYVDKTPQMDKATEYQLNLIDTPGHVDFAYEVSRSLAACEGAILVVDASQGIEAQTVSNVYKALGANLTIIPVLNKIDLQGSNVEKVSKELEQAFGFKQKEILKISAKTGEGVETLLNEIIKKIPPPSGQENKEFKALVFDTYYDNFLGVVALARVVQGNITQNELSNKNRLAFCATKETCVPKALA